jgi:hypothetical protein
MWTQEKVHTKNSTLEVSTLREWKKFSEEELAALCANPYVKSATANMVRFTADFKEEFWRRYSEGVRGFPRQQKPPGFPCVSKGAAV